MKILVEMSINLTFYEHWASKPQMEPVHIFRNVYRYIRITNEIGKRFKCVQTAPASHDMNSNFADNANKFGSCTFDSFITVKPYMTSLSFLSLYSYTFLSKTPNKLLLVNLHIQISCLRTNNAFASINLNK